MHQDIGLRNFSTKKKRATGLGTKYLKSWFLNMDQTLTKSKSWVIGSLAQLVGHKLYHIVKIYIYIYMKIEKNKIGMSKLLIKIKFKIQAI